MTNTARKALADCEGALNRLKSGDTEDSWRTDWAGTVALLRAVGHALTTDSNVMPQIREAADAAHRDWLSTSPDHQIFRGFILRERNNVLKEYKFGTERKQGALLLESGHGIQLENGGGILLLESEFFELTDGPYKGRDGREVAEEAIAWWERELDKIERSSRIVRAGNS